VSTTNIKKQMNKLDTFINKSCKQAIKIKQ